MSRQVSKVGDDLTLSRGRSIFYRILGTLPYGDDGVPPFIYDSSLLPDNLHDLSKSEVESALKSVRIPLCSSHDGSVIILGQLAWSRLVNEDDRDFGAFSAYLVANAGGVNTDYHSVWRDGFSKSYDYPTFYGISQSNYWAVRVACHHRFARIQSENQRAIQLESMRRKAGSVVSAMLDDSSNYFEGGSWMNDLSAEQIISVLGKAVKLRKDLEPASSGVKVQVNQINNSSPPADDGIGIILTEKEEASLDAGFTDDTQGQMQTERNILNGLPGNPKDAIDS